MAEIQYQTVTWGRVISPGTIVKGKDGQPWELVSLEQWADQVSHAKVKRRDTDGEWIIRTKLVKWTDPCDVDIRWLADREIDGPCTCGPMEYCHREDCHGGRPEPEVDHAVWQFPPLTDRKHLESHLFIVHGEFASTTTPEHHMALHNQAAQPDSGGWPEGSYPHLHTTPKKEK